MTSSGSMSRAQPSVADVEEAVALASRVPSADGTRPWRFVLTADTLELWADRRRQPDVADLDGRALLVSCGGALHLAGLGLTALGWRTMTDRLPDPAEPDLLARVRFIGRRTANERILRMAAAAARRLSDRRPFRPGPIPSDVLDDLCATTDPGVYVHALRRPDQRLELVSAVSWAEAPEAGDPADQAEPAYLVVFSREDDPPARLRAGETSVRLAVKAQQLGLASSAITPALDTPEVHGRLRAQMSWPDHPQMILRAGWPPAGDDAPPDPDRPGTAGMLTVARPAGA